MSSIYNMYDFFLIYFEFDNICNLIRRRKIV